MRCFGRSEAAFGSSRRSISLIFAGWCRIIAYSSGAALIYERESRRAQRPSVASGRQAFSSHRQRSPPIPRAKLYIASGWKCLCRVAGAIRRRVLGSGMHLRPDESGQLPRLPATPDRVGRLAAPAFAQSRTHPRPVPIVPCRLQPPRSGSEAPIASRACASVCAPRVRGSLRASPPPAPPETVLARLSRDTSEPVLTLPSGGDCSYPGMVWHDGLLWMSYYSSHEDKRSIYLAKIRLPEFSR